MEVVELEEVGEPLVMLLGHNLVTASHWRTGPFTDNPGDTFFREHIRAISKFLNVPAQQVPVLMNNVDWISTNAQGEADVMEYVGETKRLRIINRYDGSNA